MPTTIKLKNGSGAPAASDLVQGEPAFDLTNKRLYTEDSGGNVLEIGTKPSTIDIDAGTIDGAVIGGSSAAAGTFTTITGSGDLAIDTDTLFVDVSADKVGIGTTGPQELLHVYNAGIARVEVEGTDNIAAFKATNNQGSYAWFVDSSANKFHLYDFTGSATRVTLDGSGSVGIGDDAPAAKLEVNGNVIAKTDTDATNTGSVTLDFGSNQNFVLTLTGNVTLANPTTEVVGQSGFIVFIQDSTGGRTVSLGTDYETAGGAGLTLSSAASTTDIVPYVVAASGRILLGAPQLAFS